MTTPACPCRLSREVLREAKLVDNSQRCIAPYADGSGAICGQLYFSHPWKEQMQIVPSISVQEFRQLVEQVDNMKYANDKYGATSCAEWIQSLRAKSDLSFSFEFQQWLEHLAMEDWWISQNVESFPESGDSEVEICQPFVTSIINTLALNQRHEAFVKGNGYLKRSVAIDPPPPNVLQDAHRSKSFHCRKPDIVMRKAGLSGPCSITMLGDVKGRTQGKFVDEEIGHILDMSRDLMTNHQFLRPFLLCFLTDGYRFQFFKCIRQEESIFFHYSDVFHGVKGWQILFALRALSPETLGLEMNEVEGYTIINGLGAGRFSRVYEVHHNTNPDSRYVLKYLSRQAMHMGRHEENILRLLNNENIQNVPVVIELIERNSDSALVVTPMGTPIILATQCHRITPQMSLDLLSILRHAHQLNIIHRDVKPENILLNKIDTKEIILTDWGSAVKLDDLMNGGCSYEGTPLYGEGYTLGVMQHPTKSLDLCCLVKSIYTIKQQRYPRCKLDRNSINAHWESVARDFPSFQTLLNFAYLEDYDGLENSFRAMWF